MMRLAVLLISGLLASGAWANASVEFTVADIEDAGIARTYKANWLKTSEGRGYSVRVARVDALDTSWTAVGGLGFFKPRSDVVLGGSIDYGPGRNAATGNEFDFVDASVFGTYIVNPRWAVEVDARRILVDTTKTTLWRSGLSWSPGAVELRSNYRMSLGNTTTRTADFRVGWRRPHQPFVGFAYGNISADLTDLGGTADIPLRQVFAGFSARAGKLHMTLGVEVGEVGDVGRMALSIALSKHRP